MGFCLSKCVTGIDHVYDPSQDNNRVISNNNLFVVRPPCDRSIKIHTDIENICRICFCEEENQMLESFCDCKGSIRWMHRSCLIQWMETSGNKDCRVCNKPFDIWGKTKIRNTNNINIISAIELPNSNNEFVNRSRNNRRIYNNNLRNRSVENIIEEIGYNPIINLPGSLT